MRTTTSSTTRAAPGNQNQAPKYSRADKYNELRIQKDYFVKKMTTPKKKHPPCTAADFFAILSLKRAVQRHKMCLLQIICTIHIVLPLQIKQRDIESHFPHLELLVSVIEENAVDEVRDAVVEEIWGYVPVMGRGGGLFKWEYLKYQQIISDIMIMVLDKVLKL